MEHSITSCSETAGKEPKDAVPKKEGPVCACLKCTWCSDEIVACTGTFLQVFRPEEIVVAIYHIMSIYIKFPVIII